MLRLTALLALAGMFGLTGAARAVESPDAKAITRQYGALTRALNARDTKVVKSIIHPSFKGKSDGGRTMGYTELLKDLAEMPPGMKISARIERIEGTANAAAATVTWHSRFKDREGVDRQEQTRRRDRWKKLGGQWRLVGGEEVGRRA